MSTSGNTWKEKAIYKHSSWSSFVINAVVRLVQFASGLVCFIIYYLQIHSEKYALTTSTAFREWAGLLAGAVSSGFALIEALPYLPPVYFPLDFVVVIMYTVVFACYGQVYLSVPLIQASNEAASAHQTQLLDATFFDGAMMALWALTFVTALVRWQRRRKYNKMIAEQA